MTINSQIPREWFEKGNHDISDAILLFREGGFTDSICYHCHQAVEKYLKGYLLLKKGNYPRIHELSVLLDKCVEIDKIFIDFFDEVKFLDKFYIESKYPMDSPKMFSQEEAKQAVEAAEKIISFINEKTGK